MSEQMLVLILIFAFATVALIALGARSFTRLVELILEAIYKVEAVRKDVQQVQTHLSNGTARNSSSQEPTSTPITPETPDSTSKGP
jgi:hypothetical protein